MKKTDRSTATLRGAKESTAIVENARFQKHGGPGSNDAACHSLPFTHSSINRASLSSRHYRLPSPCVDASVLHARVYYVQRVYVHTYIRVLLSSVALHLSHALLAVAATRPDSSNGRERRMEEAGRGTRSTCARLKSTTTTTPCLSATC